MKKLFVSAILTMALVLSFTVPSTAQGVYRSGASHFRFGTTDPTQCNPSTGDVFSNTTGGTTQVPKYCDATGHWTAFGAAAPGNPFYRGAYNASGNAFPTTGGSGSAGAILAGDTWTISVGGTLAGTAILVGDTLYAITDTPGSTDANWGRLNKSLGYTPIDAATKAAASGVASLDGSSKVVQDPANANTSPGSGVIPKADGGGKIAAGFLPTAFPACAKYTVDSTNAAFIVADVVADVTLVALPARGKVTGLNIKHSVAWAGAAVTSMTVSVGDGTDSLAYSTAAFDIFQTVAATAFQDTSTFISTTMASSNIVAHFTSNTNFGSGSVTVLTFGSVDIDVCMVTLP